MSESNALESIQDIFGRYSTGSVQQHFRNIYTRSLGSTSNHEANQITLDTTSVDLSAIDEVSNNQLNEKFEKRSETPPPSYNDCVLSSPNKLRKNETHIVPNPLSTIENSKSLYVNIPSRVIKDQSSPISARPSSTHPNTIPDNNITQQINNSVIGAYHGMLGLLNGNSVHDEREQNSNQEAVSPSTSNVRSKKIK